MDREKIQLPSMLARILSAYAHGGLRIPSLTFAAVKNVKGIAASTNQVPSGTLAIDEFSDIIASLDGHYGEHADTATPLEIELVDDSFVQTNYVTRTKQKTSLSIGQPPRLGTELTLTEWHWSTSAKPVAWVAMLHGASFRWTHNIFISGHGSNSANSLRLEGNAAWHLMPTKTRGNPSCVAILDTRGQDLDRIRLLHDFLALEFLFGTPLQLSALIGVTETNKPVSAMDASFGYRFRPQNSSEPPLPDERTHTWMAVAFPRLVRALRNPQPNSETIGTCGYVDSTIGHIDGQYLFAQVALEAVAARLAKEKKPLVKDVAAWEEWVESLRPILAEHAIDASTVEALRVKLRIAAKPTTSHLVKDVLNQMDITIPKEGLSEVNRRGGVAHTLSMTGGKPYDVERDIQRVRTIRTLLAAIVLKHIGYEGALAGWELDDRGWRKTAEWFPTTSAAAEEASRLYLAIS